MPPADPIRFDEVRAWVFDHALPLWTAHGLDPVHGGAREALTFDGADAGLDKRVRTQARQVYAFSHAALLGAPGAAAAADAAWDFLRAKGRREDGAYVRRLAPDGRVLDPACDAYDMAFVLFALAWRARLGDPDAAVAAHEVLDVLERRLGLGAGRGFAAAEDQRDARLQNPHMHLLEAALELAAATGEERFSELAGAVARLLAGRITPEGMLAEAFDKDWAPIGGAARRVEPGHLYEWAWLLHRAENVAGRTFREEARALVAFAEARGLDPRTRFAVDALEGGGLTPSLTARLWPQTEALKAHLALFEHQGIDGRGRIAEITAQILDRYLAIPLKGGWMDRFGPGWSPAAANIPASILYHLLVAFTDLLRLEPELRAGG